MSFTKYGIIQFSLPLVLGALGLLILLGVLISFKDAIDPQRNIPDSVCAFSLKMRSLSNFFIGDNPERGFPILCSTVRFSVSKESAYDYALVGEGLREGVMRQVADEITRCRRRFELADSKEFLFAGKDCYICAQFNITGELPEIPTNEFTEFLYFRADPDKRNYLQSILAPRRTTEQHALALSEAGLRPMQTYAILYVDQHAPSLLEQALKIGGLAKASASTVGLASTVFAVIKPKAALITGVGTAAVLTLGVAFDRLINEYSDYNKILLVRFNELFPTYEEAGVCESYLV